MAGQGDPDNAIPKSAEDWAARTHDQNRAVAIYNGDYVAATEADLTFGLQSFVNFFSDGNPYDLAAAAFIGVGTVALDAASGIALAAWSVLSGLLPHSDGSSNTGGTTAYDGAASVATDGTLITIDPGSGAEQDGSSDWGSSVADTGDGWGGGGGDFVYTHFE